MWCTSQNIWVSQSAGTQNADADSFSRNFNEEHSLVLKNSNMFRNPT